MNGRENSVFNMADHNNEDVFLAEKVVDSGFGQVFFFQKKFYSFFVSVQYIFGGRCFYLIASDHPGHQMRNNDQCFKG